MAWETQQTGTKPEPITALDSFSIVQMAAGHCHSLFLTNRGVVLTCGYRRHTNPTNLDIIGESHDQLVPQVISSLADQGRITQIVAGWGGSLFLSENGQVLQALLPGTRVDCQQNLPGEDRGNAAVIAEQVIL